MLKPKVPRYTEEEISILRNALTRFEGNQSRAAEACVEQLPHRTLAALKYKIGTLNAVSTTSSHKHPKKKWTKEEDDIIFNVVKNNWGKGKHTLGVCFMLIADELKHRTVSAISKRWTQIKYLPEYEISRTISITGNMSYQNNSRIREEKQPARIKKIITNFFKSLLKWQQK